MSIEMVASFDALRALRLLFKLEEEADADSAYLRNLLVADVKRHIAASTTAAAPEEAPIEDEAGEAELEEALVEAEAKVAASENASAKGRGN